MSSIRREGSARLDFGIRNTRRLRAKLALGIAFALI